MSDRLVVKVGEYRKDDETKGEYLNIGALMSNDNGQYILLDPKVNLAGVLTQQNIYAHSQGKKSNKNVMVSVFSDQGRQQSAPHQQAPQQSQPNDNSFKDDIPF